MPSNLTRAEATERASLIRVESYQVDLDVTGDELTFGSLTTVRFSCASPGAASFIDLTAESVSEITLNGQAVPAACFDGDRITLHPLAAANELTVRARCAYSRSSEGMHRFTDPADKLVYLYTDFEPFDAHRMYACFDQPDLKAAFAFTVTCPDTWLVVSNMAPELAGQPAGPGAERWVFPPTPVMSSYITALAAGPYHCVRAEHDGIGLGLYCRQSLASYLDPDEIFDITKSGFDHYHRVFGIRYQFGKYDQVFVPEFKTGAMENAGCVTIVEQYIFRSRVTDFLHEMRADTILHEMAHMWFGDLVTMRWWDDLWLNESFASWASVVAQCTATRWVNAWTTFNQLQKTFAYRADQLPSSHPIAADITDIAAVEVNFDGITYSKGAAVIRQLVAYVGADNFMTGLRSYFARHAWANASLADLLATLEEASGRQLAAWSAAWLESAGVNTLRPSYRVHDGRYAEVAVVQEAPQEHPVLRPHRIAIGLYDRGEAGLCRRVRVELDVSGERTVVPELAGEKLADLILLNDEDLTFAKIRLDEPSLRTVVSSVGEITDPLARALCLAAAWDMCRDAEMPSRDYVDLVLTAADALTDISVLQSVLRQAVVAARRFADPARRSELRDRIATALRTRLTGAEPGSDAQLAYAQSLAEVAVSPADLNLLARLLEGTVTIDGLAVDTDLRWKFLQRLVSCGLAGEEAIDAEHDRDRTDAGERNTAWCMASIPDQAAKEAAWAQITSGDLPSAILRAAVSGFNDGEREDLLIPFAARFFDVVADRWQSWSTDVAQYFAQFAYPAWVITPEAIAAADEYIESTSPPPPLRRLLAEGRDGVARALRCRERDAAAS
jgi:aminopeptidase N